MPASPEKSRLARLALGFYELLESWWQHRTSFLISIVITLLALTLYYFTFLGERATPIFAFLQRFEYDSLDTRFRYRPVATNPTDPNAPDPNIAIVDIDQHSQEVLGRWPFSRSNFATLLDNLHADGAAVASFDITFSKPETSAATIQAFEKVLESRKKRIERLDPQFAKELQELSGESSTDQKFAAAIQRFGNVVLGNYFLYTEAD